MRVLGSSEDGIEDTSALACRKELAIVRCGSRAISSRGVLGGRVARHESLDSDHAALMAEGALTQGHAGPFLQSIEIIAGLRRHGFCSGRHSQKLAAQGKLLLPETVAEKTIVANFLESIGKNVNQESADELIGGKGHRFVAIAVTIILPLETDLIVGDIEQAVVGNSDTVSIAADIVEHLFGTCKRRLGVDTPFDLFGVSKVTRKFIGVGKGFQGGGELQLAGVEGILKILQK